jgi:hypothetical protein
MSHIPYSPLKPGFAIGVAVIVFSVDAYLALDLAAIASNISNPSLSFVGFDLVITAIQKRST